MILSILVFFLNRSTIRKEYVPIILTMLLAEILAFS